MNNKLLISAIFVILLIGGGIFFLTQRDTPTTSQVATSEKTTEKKSDAKNNTSLLQFGKQAIGQAADCSTYTSEEVSHIWGVPIVDTDNNTVTETSDGGKLYSCGYNETNSGLGLSFIVEYREFTSVDAAKQDIQNVRDGAKFGDEVYFVQDEVSGIGDEAFFSVPKNKINDPKNPNQQLYARKDNVVFLISGVNIDGVKSDYRDKIIESFKLHLQ